MKPITDTLGAIHPHLTMIHTVVFVKPITNHWTTAIHPHLTMIHTVVFVKPITNHWVQYTHT